MVRDVGSRGEVFRADLDDMSQIERLFSDLQSRFGGLDILVNNASMFSPSSADQTTPAVWDQQMNSNAKAPFFVAQHAARHDGG